jgi:hypothetical protein
MLAAKRAAAQARQATERAAAAVAVAVRGRVIKRTHLHRHVLNHSYDRIYL